MANTIFGKRIRKLRHNNDMTMDELATKLNITKSRISMWENKGVVPREDVLIELSKLFKVSIDYLLGNENLEGSEPDNQRLNYIQRNLGKLDDDRLEKAESVLRAVFEDIFEEEEDHGGL
ncbi:XRE family transcriptional regulator [Ruminococcus sp. OM05-10BH]|nr:XRE family transcriptional regulator [Ruminococcus sp. OM05-10BH]